MDTHTGNISYVYIIGIVLWVLYFRYMGGLSLINKDTTLLVFMVFIVGVGLMLLNFYFASKEDIGNYESELAIYSYVEKNATVALGVPLGVAFLISFVTKDRHVQSNSIAFALVGFLILLIGVLNIVWMPTNDKHYINRLKHIKTVIMTIGILSVGMAMAIIASYYIKDSKLKVLDDKVVVNYLPQNV